MNTKKIKKVLVTGGAGYVGNVLVRYLLEKGYEIRIFDVLMYSDVFLQDIKDRIEIIEGDIRNISFQVLDGIDAIIHLAGLSTEPTSQYNPRLTDLINHLGTEKIAFLAKEAKIERFIFASSCSVYFTYNTPIDPPLSREDDIINPISPYSLSKRAAEQALLELVDENFKPIIFRKGTIYGLSPRMRFDLVLNSFVKDSFLKRKMIINCGGRIWRPMIDIKDVVWAYEKALTLPIEEIGGKIINVSSENWYIEDLAKNVQSILKEKKNIDIEIEILEAGITRNYKADNDLFKKLFQFSPQRSLEDAIIEIWNKLEKNPEEANRDVYYNDKWQLQLMSQGKFK